MCFTQHKREGVIFHGDCQYRSGLEWYDWVVINWEGNNPTIGQIYCFVDLKSSCANSHPLIVNGNNIPKGECYAVISSFSSGTLQNIPGSSLFVRECCLKILKMVCHSTWLVYTVYQKLHL